MSVEIRNAQGEAQPGFTFGDCDEVSTDSVTRVVTWKGNAAIRKLAGKPVRLCVRVRNANLFAIQFQ